MKGSLKKAKNKKTKTKTKCDINDQILFVYGSPVFIPTQL